MYAIDILAHLNADIRLTSLKPMFYVPPAALLSAVWKEVSLHNSSDDKAIELYSLHGQNKILKQPTVTQDFSLLVGFAATAMTGLTAGTGFDWTMSNDNSSLVYFSPQTGSTVAHMGEISRGFF
ncbi:hypothetical protein K438DRAFT_1997454 [Mycena galopus ATCC 62051]|nr:hypothetical protein K438DRAFT_1997454 [Mycena galopus ATCC 62051]